MLVRIAIVEDEKKEADLLEEYIGRFSREYGCDFTVSRYADGLAFLDGYTSDFDIVFMDIQMPNIDGISTAQRLRAIDTRVALVFITNMAQYAINGYEVEAIDFVLKPVSYFRLQTLLLKIMRKLSEDGGRYVYLKLDKQHVRVRVSDIRFVEVSDHILRFDIGGKLMEGWGTLTEIKKQLYEDEFVKVNSSVLVNLQYVSAVRREEVVAAGRQFYLTRAYKKAFLDAFVNFKTK